MRPHRDDVFDQLGHRPPRRDLLYWIIALGPEGPGFRPHRRCLPACGGSITLKTSGWADAWLLSKRFGAAALNGMTVLRENPRKPPACLAGDADRTGIHRLPCSCDRRYQPKAARLTARFFPGIGARHAFPRDRSKPGVALGKAARTQPSNSMIIAVLSKDASHPFVISKASAYLTRLALASYRRTVRCPFAGDIRGLPPWIMPNKNSSVREIPPPKTETRPPPIPIGAPRVCSAICKIASNPRSASPWPMVRLNRWYPRDCGPEPFVGCSRLPPALPLWPSSDGCPSSLSGKLPASRPWSTLGS